MTDNTKEIKTLSFEEALGELETIVKTLEAGGMDLDKSIEHYERGNSLKKHCEAKLKEAKLKVEKIVGQTEDGSVDTEPFEIA